MTPLSVPAPPPNPTTAPFWDALAEGRLVLQRCRRCNVHQHYPGEVCRRCWSGELDWVASRGLGVIWTWTIVQRPGHPAWDQLAPYGVVIVELDEGPRLVTLWDNGLDELAIERPVEIGSRRLAGHHVPVSLPRAD
ncbi:Zn-ribbon domain-containing OB-fold protein [Aeromicrobium sp. CTD01-1L150]|uniref:Zn-ribbon domain-containing OB-fold protein n=1 Tax=Aeromicrobium sp. CTD01-1L150 TaxID=3341830 RepID=UPI0035C212BF